MRRLLIAASVLPVLLAPAGAAGQTTPGAEPAPPVPGVQAGWVDFGVRSTFASGDADRVERYRALGDGAYLDRLVWGYASPALLLRVEAQNAGRDDQRYRGMFERTGLFRATVMWDQIPLFISSSTRTPYHVEGPGVLRLSDAIQLGIQEGRNTLSDIAPLTEVFESRYRRDVASGGFLFHARDDVDVRGRVSTAKRHGFMPWGGPFGFNLAVELPVPIENRTTEARFEVEWTRGASLFRLNYDGSWFQNEIERLIWDNPIKFTDSTSPTAYISGAGTSAGRMALWPDNQMHTVGATGSMALPRRTRLMANVAFGASTQNAELLPHTINSAINALELPRARTEAQATIAVANVVLTSRPFRRTSFTARYRLHDRSNETPAFELGDRVRMDQARQVFLPGEAHSPEFYDIRRQRLDLEATYAPLRFTSMRVGYALNRFDRTHRIFDHTTEHTLKASLDTTGNQWVSLHAQMEISERNGGEFDPGPLLKVGEQPGMRHFDIADRGRTRFTGRAIVTPLPYLGLHGSVAVGSDDYDESRFGLLDSEHRVYAIGSDATLGFTQFSMSYQHERYDTFQLSRQASPGPQFEDPTRDWGTDASERVNSVLSSFELRDLIPNTEARVTYDYSRSRTRYLYALGTPADERTLPEGSPVTSLPPVQQLPAVSNTLHSARLDTRYFLTRDVALGLVYLYEQYRVQDFALGDDVIRRVDLPGGLLMYYRYRPYSAHSAWVRLTYLF